MKKKFISILLAGAIAASLSACGTEQEKPESSKQTEAATSTEETIKKAEDSTQKSEKVTLTVESTTATESIATQPQEPEFVDVTAEEMKLKIPATWVRSNDAPYSWCAGDRSSISITTAKDVSFKNFSNTDLLSIAAKTTDESLQEDVASGEICGYDGYSYVTYDGVQAVVMDYTLVNDDYNTDARAVLFAYNATEYMVLAQLTIHDQPSDVSHELDSILNSIQFSAVDSE